MSYDSGWLDLCHWANMIDFPSPSNPLADKTGRRPNAVESDTTTSTGVGPIDRPRDPNPRGSSTMRPPASTEIQDPRLCIGGNHCEHKRVVCSSLTCTYSSVCSPEGFESTKLPFAHPTDSLLPCPISAAQMRSTTPSLPLSCLLQRRLRLCHCPPPSRPPQSCQGGAHRDPSPYHSVPHVLYSDNPPRNADYRLLEARLKGVHPRIFLKNFLPAQVRDALRSQ